MSNSTRQHMTIGDFLLRRLKEAGVRHLFRGSRAITTSSCCSSSRTLARCNGSAPAVS
jgi:hypothetical protein